MSRTNKELSEKREKFFKVLREAFLGEVTKIGGNSPIAKLMAIKNAYYREFEKLLEKDISEVSHQYPEFEAELYDKLFNFFSKYFSESGSIFFVKTAIHNNVYDRIYTNENDVILFWKTRDLYYIKTEKLPQSIEIEYKGYTFAFVEPDVDNYQKQSESPSSLEVRKIGENKVELKVYLKKRVEKNSLSEVIKELNKKGIKLTEEDLEVVLQTYCKQIFVDLFIHKRPKSFLTEQFDLWLYQYISPDTAWPSERLNQLNLLRQIAFKIIDFISKFEEELLKIWSKPRFVVSSNYIISLDRIVQRGGYSILKKIREHENWKKQVEEWIELGILKAEPDEIFEETLYGPKIKPDYQHLPLDTKYFKSLESEILSLFPDLEKELDGWLIRSENWQALNTILPRFRSRIKVIYIDPPYNTGSDDFVYLDKFRRSTWLTMLENRLSLAREFLREDGAILISIGDTLRLDFRNSSTAYLQLLLNQIFGEENYVATFVRKSGTAPRQDVKYIANSHDYVIVYAKDISKLRINRQVNPSSRYKFEDEYVKIRGKFALNKLDRRSIRYSNSLDYPIEIEPGEIIEVYDGKRFTKIPAPEKIVIYPGGDPKDKTWTFRWSKEKVYWGIKNGFIVFRKSNGDQDEDNPSKSRWNVYFKEYELVDNEGQPRIRTNPHDTLITEFINEQGSRELFDLFGQKVFDYPKPSSLIEYLLEMATDADSIILDFFAGSGTTAHAVMNLNKKTGGKRKFILVEVADCFDTVIIPRIKKLSYSFSWKEGKAQNADGNGVFVKYFRLEQFEDILEKAEFCENFIRSFEPFDADKKLLTYVSVDEFNDSVHYELNRLYEEIDLYETLLCLGINVPINADPDEVPIEYMKKLLWW